MMSLDTETTGSDFRHGSKPYFVTVCYDDGEQQWWEWDVDPMTREPLIPAADLGEIRDLVRQVSNWGRYPDQEIRERHGVVLQNAKFDVAALSTVVPDLEWPWGMTYDTLVAGHLLASGRPHDLTNMVLEYLEEDIRPYEDRLRKVVERCRRAVQQARLRVKRRGSRGEEDDLAHWAIAEKGRPDMPSAAGVSPWALDGWLPRVFLRYGVEGVDGDLEGCLSTYANADSSSTLALWGRMASELRKRGLWRVFEEQRLLAPVLFGMEQGGVSAHRGRAEAIAVEYGMESQKAADRCLEVARSRGYDLVLPRSGNNARLKDFIFSPAEGGGLGLPPVRRSKKTGEASLDQATLDRYLDAVLADSDAGRFLADLRMKRVRDTAVQYVRGYRRFWLPDPRVPDDPDQVVLYPKVNQTGSGTLRLSSSNPNEQNVSKREGFNLRRCFGPRPGYEWWALDYENLELRIPSYASGEESAVEVFEHPEREPYRGSYHLLVCEVLYPREFSELGYRFKEEYEATLYRRVKIGNFAVIYGAQQETADRAYGLEGAYGRVQARFPRIAGMSRRLIAEANRTGVVWTLPDRSVDPGRGYPLECSRGDRGWVNPTVPLNYVVQGTAMWIARRSMVKCAELLRGWGPDFRLVLQVHDENVFEFPRGRWPSQHRGRVEALRGAMESCGDDVGVPTPVSVAYFPRDWGTKEPIPWKK
jgi:DNA polymerase I-like protein with 3'-5' exonuclease and polymerase domains